MDEALSTGGSDDEDDEPADEDLEEIPVFVFQPDDADKFISIDPL